MQGGKLVCAVYCRVSSADQAADAKESLSGQRAAGEEWRQRNGYAAAFYVEPGLSGETISERPQMVRLLADIRAGKRACVAVRDLDRLSRSDYARAEIVKTCADAGCPIVEVSSGQVYDPRVPQHRLMLTITGAFSSLEKDMIRERTRRGRAHALQRGKVWNAPFGYRYDADAGRLVVDEAQNAVRRRMIDMLLGGAGLFKIALALNAEGIPAPRRNRGWTTSTIWYILTNPAYLGAREWNGSGVSVTQSLPPLLDLPTYHAILERLRFHKSRRGARKCEYLLTGLFRCGVCGVGMVGMSKLTRKGGKRIRYYRCANQTQANRAFKCPTPYVNADKIERRVGERVNEWCANPDGILAQIAARWHEVEDDETALRLRLIAVHSALSRKPQERQTVILQLARGRIAETESDAALEELATEERVLREEEEDLRRRLRDLEGRDDQMDSLRALLREVRRRWRKASKEGDVTTLRKDLQALRVRVIINFPDVHVASDWCE